MIALIAPVLAACIVSCGSQASQPTVESASPAAETSASTVAAAPDSLEIREWAVPWPNTRPRDPIVAADGRVWFVGQRGNYVGSLDPESGAFDRTELPPNALPHNVIVGPDGALWYAGNGDSHIGRVDPATGDNRRFEVPVRDPHTLQFAPDGMLWFTAQGANRIGRLDPATGDVQVVEPSVADARPYGIVVDGEGRPWIALFGTNRIATVDPATMEITEHSLPAAETRIRRLETASDGAVFYADYARGVIGRLDPATGESVEWTTPGGSGSRPYAMTMDDRDRVWFVETGAEPNRLVGFDPATEEFFDATPVPSGGGTVRHMVFHAPTGSLWFGTDSNTIGRARVGS